MLPTIRRMGDHAGDQSQPADHPLRMSGRGAFYSFSFDLGPEIDLIATANRLLKRDIATIAGSPSREGLRVGKRIRLVGRHQREAVRFNEFLEIFHSGNIRWWRMFQLNPKMTLRMLWTVRRYYARYFGYWVFNGIPPVADEAEDSHEGRTDVAEDSWDETRRMVEEASRGLTRSLNRRHVDGALRLRLQQQMYFPRYYRKSEPFIRLELNQALYSDQRYTDEPIAISLMIHRSGVCMLTFAMPIADCIGVDEAYEYLQAGKHRLSTVKISVPILGNRPRFMDDLYHNWGMAISHSDGLDWVRLKTPKDGKGKITVESVFLVYLNAVECAAGRRMETEWRCSTTLFQGAPKCGCNGVEAKTRHEVEFAQMMVRCIAPMPVTDDVRQDLLRNHLVESDQELWLSVGHAIHTMWKYDRVDYMRDMATIEPIESAILQYRQLEAIDHRTVNVAVRDSDLFAAQQQLASGLPEYGRNLMTDINAPGVVEGLAAKLRTPQLYSRLNDRVKVLESVVNSRFTRKQSRRSLAISVIGLGIVLILLLPRIDELINKLASLSPTSALVERLRNFVGGADQTTVAIYAVSIGLAILVLAKLSVPLPRPRSVLTWFRRPTLPRRRRNFGYSTKHDVIVTRGCSGEDSPDDQD
jgi:hypothetical protein